MVNENRSPSPGITIHTFTEPFQPDPVHYYVLRMRDSLLLWIGVGPRPALGDLAVAMSTGTGEPIATKLLGNHSCVVSMAMASRLTRRLGKQVFLSCNLPMENVGLHAQVEKRLLDEITAKPEVF